MIKLQNIDLQRGTKVLLKNASLSVFPGQKWGLIGANGSGKSSLFQLLIGNLNEDEGKCSIPRQWRVAYLQQEFKISDKTALDHVLDGDTELRQLESRMVQAADDGEKLAHLYNEMEIIDGYTATTRAQRLLQGLGFKTSDEQRKVVEFSGGWRIRLNLAQVLMCRSDALLLDEPTNHLDLNATLWLEQWLQDYSGTLLIISHDRDFLDNVVDGIVGLADHQLTSYSGNYSFYERQRAEELAQQSVAYRNQRQRIGEIEDFVRRFRAKATKAKQAQSRLKELERMQKIAPAYVNSPFNFRFPSPYKLPDQLLNLADACIGYSQQQQHLVGTKKINLGILSTSRIGLLGRNGAGKTTLLKSLADVLPLLAGKRHHSKHLRIGYFAQHQIESIDPNASCVQHLQCITPTAYEQEVRHFLGGFGFRGDRVFEPVENFSGGEKARLALAIMAWKKPNLLLLDEPTNHLDLEMRHAFSVALQAFEGAIVLVSHDRYLIKNTVEHLLLVDNGNIQLFDGNLDDYQRKLVSDHKQRPTTFSATNQSIAIKPVDKKSQRQTAAVQREQLKTLTNAIQSIEKEMQKLQLNLDTIAEKLSVPTLYTGSDAQLDRLLKEHRAAKQGLSSKSEQWIEKSEALERLQRSKV